jgi:hypothetical protein
VRVEAFFHLLEVGRCLYRKLQIASGGETGGGLMDSVHPLHAPMVYPDAHVAVLFQHPLLEAGDRSAVELADARKAFLTDERTPVAVLLFG